MLNYKKQKKKVRAISTLKVWERWRFPVVCEFPEPVNSKRIVIFVDASLQAYGAAVYTRCECHNDAVTSRRGVSKEAKRDRGTNFVG